MTSLGSPIIAAAHAQQLSIRDRILDRCLVGLFSMQTQITMLTALYLRTGRLTTTSGRLTIIARRRGGNSRALVRITSFFTSYFIQNMRGFLFILSVLLILCCFTAADFRGGRTTSSTKAHALLSLSLIKTRNHC